MCYGQEYSVTLMFIRDKRTVIESHKFNNRLFKNSILNIRVRSKAKETRPRSLNVLRYNPDDKITLRQL